MSKCNMSVREQEGGAVGGAKGLGVEWASVICPSVNMYLFTDGQLQVDGMTD